MLIKKRKLNTMFIIIDMIIRSVIFLFTCFHHSKVDCAAAKKGHPLSKYFIPSTGATEWPTVRYDPQHAQQFYDWKQFVQLKQLEFELIFALSKELLFDFIIKMRQLSDLEFEYKKDENFELGVIAATVMEKFTHMTTSYKKASAKIYWDSEVAERTTDVLSLYGIILSDYNEIRMEKNLYYDIMKKSSQKLAQKKRLLTKGHTLEQAEAIEELGEDATDEMIAQHALKKFTPSELEAMKAAADRPPDSMSGGKARGPPRPTRGRRSSGMGLSLTNETVYQAHEEYKKSLRQQKWLEKWQQFNPEVEGIPVNRRLSNMARNNSNYLGLNFF